MRDKMKILKQLSVLAMILSSCAAQSQKLVILHTNDTHSQIEPMRVGQDAGLGGVDRRLQFINGVREQYGKENVLLLDGGDYNQGTPYFTVAKGDLEVELCNALGYDVATLGNHEFDNGLDELARRLKMANHTTVTCNYDFSKSVLKDLIKPYTIVKRAGLKIGIIGVAPAKLKSLVMFGDEEELKRLNTIEEVNRWAEHLKSQEKCDLVILLSHLGYSGGNENTPSDIVVAENSRNIDLIIGGHSHTYLKEAKEVANLDGVMVPIVQASGRGVVVGKFEINLSRP